MFVFFSRFNIFAERKAFVENKNYKIIITESLKPQLQNYHNRIMEATNNNKLETYAPFEIVNPFIYNLVYNQQIIDLTFAQFLERHESFKVDQFSVPLIFWMSLHESHMKHARMELKKAIKSCK